MEPAPGSSQSVRVACSASAAFSQWMERAGGSLAVSTYQAGKVALLPDGTVVQPAAAAVTSR